MEEVVSFSYFLGQLVRKVYQMHLGGISLQFLGQ